CFEAHLDVVVETDPNLALEQLKAGKKDPTCLVVHYYYPLHHLHGKELIDAYRQQSKLHNPKVALISTERSIHERMEEMETGIDYFLKYPISDEHISALLSSLISESALLGSKVLVVDDDLAVCGLIEDALQEIGVEVHTIQDETKILETLDAFTPDVLLLDLGLNTYKGTEILKLLRSDTRSMGLPIVIITVSNDRTTLDLAVEYGANIVIQKPIDLSYLKLTINNLLTSRDRGDLLTLRDPLTGLLHPLVFQNKLKEAVEFYRAHDETVLLLLIGIKEYERLTKELPQKTRNDILIALSNVLRGTFSISHLSAYRAPGIFECYFENVDPNHIQFLFQEFLRRAHRELTHLEYHNIEFAAGAAAALLPRDDYKPLLETAESNLRISLQKEGNHFFLSETGKGTSPKSLKPFCVIVDDDKDLTTVLEYAFKRNGFDVVCIHTGQEALHYFAALKKMPHNFVVILDRVLPDMDGLDIFKNLKAKFSENLKVIFLSTLGGEEDTLMGLKEGAYDYLSKPVSIDILIQKVKNILEL
ncbi:MAG: response regulator, partial [Chlamydiia bacterium]|nr:response regulator [Chlamydiia bacterium]